MADIVSPEVRSRMMSGIRGKNTRPELLIRRGLFAMGFRFRIHSKKLSGKPDLVLPRYRAAIFVDGCFWHGHDCALFKWPSSNVDFWRSKILRNRELDEMSTTTLRRQGWKVLRIWECALKGPTRRQPEDVLEQVADWVCTGRTKKEIRGKRITAKAA